MQQDKPDNYLISTGITHSIRDFCEIAFKHVGIKDWEKYIVIDPQFKRPAELFTLQGKSDKAQKILGWKPKVKFEELVKMMMDADMERLKTAQKI
jgi:GDPmannose 4,6-dehydratase